LLFIGLHIHEAERCIILCVFSNANLLIPNIFNFLVLLSYERYHTKTIIQMPKVIQLCDGIMASGQDPTTHGNNVTSTHSNVYIHFCEKELP